MRIKLIAPDGHWETSVSSGSTFAIQKVNLPLLAALTPPRHEVTIVDECFAQDDPGDGADLVGITVMTELAARAYRIADGYRERGVPVVLGGIHPSVLPEEALGHADAVAIGEAEETWPRIVEDASRGSLERVYRAPGPTDMRRLPVPDRTRYPRRARGSFAPMAVGIETTRGCPYDCPFCSVGRIMGRALRRRSIHEVLHEIARIDSPNLFLVDDSVGLNRSFARELFGMMAPLGRRWVGQGTVSLAQDLGLLKAMRRSGCMGLLVGFESLAPSTQEGMKKIHGLRIDFDEAMRRFHGEGIPILGAFVTGCDHERPDVFDRTLEFAMRSRLDGVQIRILTPFPGTRTYAELEREGRLLDPAWWLHGYAPGTLLYRPRGMTPEQLVDGTNRLIREVYSRAGILGRFFGMSPLARGLHGIGLFAGFNFGTRMRYYRGLETPQPMTVRHPSSCSISEASAAASGGSG